MTLYFVLTNVICLMNLKCSFFVFNWFIYSSEPACSCFYHVLTFLSFVNRNHFSIMKHNMSVSGDEMLYVFWCFERYVWSE